MFPGSVARLLLRQPTLLQRKALSTLLNKSSSNLLRVPLRQVQPIALNRVAAAPDGVQYPESHAGHFKIERIWAAMLIPLLPAAYFVHGPAMDTMLSVAIALHTHWTTPIASTRDCLLLTYLLLDRLKESGGARIVNVSSLMHALCRHLSLDSLNFDHEPYNALEAYCRSKLAQVMWTRHLAKQLADQDVSVFALNPGVLATPISRYFVKGALGDSLASLIMPIALVANALIAKTAFEGAQTTLYLAAAPGVEQQSGGYFADCALQAPFALARDEQLAEALTNKSIELVGAPTKKQPPHRLLETDL
uniref:Uncharacterized protein n=1 Tax=Plectus sambesii TaxID=2011161 RepID=A0A914XNF5_9BILA